MRIPIIIPIKGKGFINQGSGFGFGVLGFRVLGFGALALSKWLLFGTFPKLGYPT